MRVCKKSLDEMEYVIRYPKNYDNKKVYPVLVFMHGAGTRGNDINKVLENPFFLITDEYNDFPFVTVAPLCHKNTWFDLFETVIKLIHYIYNSDFTDQNRFYAMGASMGGYAVWQMAMSYPELFAAIVPICGGGMYWNAGRLKNVPVWAFHGDSDTVVNVIESTKMTDAIIHCGGQAKLTIYKDCDHNAWTQTYSNPKVFEWLLSNTNKNADIESDGINDSKIYG